MRKNVWAAAGAVAMLSSLPALAGSVFVASNAADGNRILVFDRSPIGGLTSAGSVATGGNGTGAGLGNQGGLVVSEDGRNLYVVNAGSDSISSFALGPQGPTLLATVPAGGSTPLSLALHKDLLYVVLAEGISGFRVQGGVPEPIAGSSRPLSAPGAGPAQGSFSPDGGFLVVTEKNTNSLTVFSIGADGTPISSDTFPAVGTTPFGFAFGRRGQLFVSEAFGGAPSASAVTVYRLDYDGSLDVIDPSVPTLETAACWLAISNDGRYAYTTNTGDGTLTGFAIASDGTLTPLDADGKTATAGAGTIDLSFSINGRFVYALSSGSHTISGFEIGADGSLTPVGDVTDLPAGANGLAAL